MVVDFHTHTFPDKIAAPTVKKLQGFCHAWAYTDGSLGALAASMQEAGVDASLVLPVATNTHQVPHVNDVSAKINNRGAETGIWSLGCMHPDYDGWKEELSRIAQLGLKGVKLHPAYQGVDLDDPRYLRILDRCGELGLFVLVHAGLDIGLPDCDNCTPAHALRAVRQVGPVKLILAHMGGWKEWDQVEELLSDTPVCLDTSYSLGAVKPSGDGYYTDPADLQLLGQEQFMRIVRQFGADRIFFGTDSPWGGQKESLEELRALPLEPSELAAILGGNAQKLLGL